MTLEARRVFDYLLKRSLSHHDTPQQSDSSCGADPTLRHVHTAHHAQARRSHEKHISEKLLKDKLAELSLSESHDEPDYVYTHSLARNLTTKTSVTSATLERSTSSVRSSTHCVHTTSSAVSSPKLPPRSCHTPPSPLRAPTAQHDDVSSTSTEDYEFTDPNEFRSRKKKSFLRRQAERFMHVIRRRTAHPLDFEVESQDSSRPHKYKKKKRTTRMTPSCRHLPTREHLRSSTTCMVRDDSMQQEVLRTAASSPDHVTHYTDIELFQEESVRRCERSPSLWRRSKRGLSREDSHASDKEKSKLGSFLRSIKRKSSFKSKRKDTTVKGIQFTE